MKRRELFNLGLAASIASVLPKPKAMTYDPTQIRLFIGGHEMAGIVSGEFVQFDGVQRSLSYNHLALHRVGEGSR